MAIKLVVEGNKFCVQTQEFSTAWLPDTPSNRYALVVWLRWLADERGKPLFTLQELAVIVGSENRQAASQHVEDFRQCGEDFRDFVLRQRKVDETVVACVQEEIEQTPLVSPAVLAERVRERLGRTDLTEANIRAALAQVPCTAVLAKLRRRLAAGQVQYKEEALLEEIMAQGARPGAGAGGLELPAADHGMVLADPTVIKRLVTPDVPLDQVSPSLASVAFLMTLYRWGVPLSVLGRWMQVHKTTVLRWLLGLAAALWPIVSQWILDHVKASQVYVDEKWLKIKGRWHYWVVVLDVETELPVLAALLPSRSRSRLSLGGSDAATDRQISQGRHHRWSVGLSLFNQAVGGSQTRPVPFPSPAAGDGLVEEALGDLWAPSLLRSNCFGALGANHRARSHRPAQRSHESAATNFG